jgi:Fur family transcriptional regulator, ferric uptake regulator
MRACAEPPLLPNAPVMDGVLPSKYDEKRMTTDGKPPVAEPKLNIIEAQCVAKGMRMTEQRRVVARVLAGSADHPDVEELYRRCATIDQHISISTVYRTVKLFEDAGIIERHDFREGRARYEQIPDTHHDHLINLRTGEVIEFRSEDIERLQSEIARRLGYRLVDHRLELYAVPLADDKAKS